MNTVIASGEVGELKQGVSQKGTAWANFLLVVTKEIKDKPPRIERYDMKAIGKHVERLVNGARVVIAGTLQEETWESEKYGPGRKMVVFAAHIECVGGAPPPVPESQKPVAETASGDNGEFGEDETPF